MGSISSTTKLFANGMQLVQASEAHLFSFLDNISKENVRELEEFYRIAPEDAIASLRNDPLVHAVVFKGKVVCLTCLDPDGHMWAMFSEELGSNKIRFARASTALIQYYHSFSEELHASTWIKNTKAIQWLAFLGFEPVSVQENHNKDEYVTFVRCAEYLSGNRAEELRPVIH